MGKRVSKCLRKERAWVKRSLSQGKTPPGNHVVRVTLLLIGIHTFVEGRLIKIKDDLIIYCELICRNVHLNVAAVADTGIGT
jgi:hypothetical protein